MSTKYFIVISISLLVSMIWIINRLTGLKWLENIRKKDKKRIVIPSFTFLLSPFLSIWFISALETSDTAKALISVSTFALGQILTKMESTKEKEEQKAAFVSNLIMNLRYPAYKSLFMMEAMLSKRCHLHLSDQNNQELADEALCEADLKAQFLLEETNNASENLRGQLNSIYLIDNSNIVSALFYMERVKQHSIYVIRFLTENKLTENRESQILGDTWTLVAENYEFILSIAEDFFFTEPEKYKNIRKDIVSQLEGEKRLVLERERVVLKASEMLPTYLKLALWEIQKLDEKFNLQLKTAQELCPPDDENPRLNAFKQ